MEVINNNIFTNRLKNLDMNIFTKFLLFIIFTAFSIPSNDEIHYKHDREKKTTIAKKHKKAKMKGLFKRWKEKWILKRFTKKAGQEKISKRANTSLILGASSIMSVGVGILGAYSSLYLLLPLIFFSLAIVLAIIGSIHSLKFLGKTGHDPKTYRRDRRRAFLGLFLSLLCIIPVIFILVIPK